MREHQNLPFFSFSFLSSFLSSSITSPSSFNCELHFSAFSFHDFCLSRLFDRISCDLGRSGVSNFLQPVKDNRTPQPAVNPSAINRLPSQTQAGAVFPLSLGASVQLLSTSAQLIPGATNARTTTSRGPTIVPQQNLGSQVARGIQGRRIAANSSSFGSVPSQLQGQGRGQSFAVPNHTLPAAPGKGEIHHSISIL